MKKIKYLILGVLTSLIAPTQLRGQDSIDQQTISVGLRATSHLIFDEPILSVDLGSSDILAERAVGLQNVLKVRAAHEAFDPTNLTVVTSDGQLHGFLVNYVQNPIDLQIRVPQRNAHELHGITGHGKIVPSNVRRALDWVRHTELSEQKISDTDQKVTLSCDGIFTDGKLIYFRLRMINESLIPYRLLPIRFFLKHKKKAKRTPIQEIELVPEHRLGQVERLEPFKPETMVLALELFTLSKGQYLSVQMEENAGGRNLQIRAKNKHLLKGQLVPMLNQL